METIMLCCVLYNSGLAVHMNTVTKILVFVLIVVLLSLYNKCLVMNTSSIPATALEENSFKAVLKFLSEYVISWRLTPDSLALVC